MTFHCTFRNKNNEICKQSATHHIFYNDYVDCAEDIGGEDYNGMSLCPDHYATLKQVYNLTK